MNTVKLITAVGLFAALMTCAAARAQAVPDGLSLPTLPGGDWEVHDPRRPAPRVITPSAIPGGPPSDAIVLFDGSSLDAWSSPRPWLIVDGELRVPPRTPGEGDNNLVSRETFGDIQLHLEFKPSSAPRLHSQDRGNSGIWFMQRYEVQILDAYNNPTYADGTLGAIYGWKPPLVNAARPPEEWQTYDIVFERPHFDDQGQVVRPAHVTVLLNGVLVQNHQAMLGVTVWRRVAGYEAHADEGSIQLQDHASPVSFRNIWVRRLSDQGGAGEATPGMR